tara:strand:+ start:205 stop:1167 length:963 start_codon:yes stop_codon:yes gene_type:complete
MNNPNSTIGQLLTITLDNYAPKIIDNVLNNHPLYAKLQAKGNIVKASGGATFQEKLFYAANGTVQYQGAYDTLNTTSQDVISTATFAQKIMTGSVETSDLELKQNAGEQKIVDLLQSKLKNLKTSVENTMGTSVYADGTGTGGKDIGGLQLLVADAPTTGTVGGINRANYSFWQNKLYDFSVESVTPSATTIQASMDTLYLRCQAQAVSIPDLIMADSVYFTYFKSSLNTIQRITDDKKGSLGYVSYMYNGSDVFYDPECPASHMYFLNTDHIFLKYLGKSLFETGETQRAFNQLAYVTPIVFVGNMTIDNARVHGVMHA